MFEETETKTEAGREALLLLPIPKGGCSIDLGDEFVYILRPLDRNTLSMARKLINSGKSLEAAIALVDTLAADGSPRASKIPDNEIGVLLGLENAVAGLIEPREATIKKN